MVAALLAGAFAGVVAIIVSLPLQSPDDLLFNSATVAIGALVAAVAAGLLWRGLRYRVVPFEAALAVVFVIVALAALAGESQLDRAFEFTAPLAAIVLGGIGLLTPVIHRARVPYWLAPAGAVVALAAGLALASQGDEESGRLALPAVQSTSAAAAGATSPAAAGSATTAAGAATSTSAAGTSAAGRTFRAPADVKGVTFVVGEGSEATFTVREKLASLPASSDAIMRSKALTGEVHLDGQPSTVTLDTLTLASDQSRRDNAVRMDTFRSRRTATFTFTDVGPLPDSYTSGAVIKRTVSGTVTIGTVSKPSTWDIEARMDGSTLFVLGRMDFTWADFQIPPPNARGVAQVEDNVHAEVLISAKPK